MKRTREIRIALADLAYLSKDDYVQTVPLAVGYIAAYLQQEVGGVQIDLFKDPQKLANAFLKSPKSYACLALANYAWNFHLNRHFLQMARQRNPNLITVMGGPNIDGGEEAGLKEFFQFFPELDFYLGGEGEYRFAALIKNLLQKNLNLRGVWEGLPVSVIGYDREQGRIFRGKGEDYGPCDCRRLPSPYLTGLLDKFLENPHLVPIIETNRGCPYSCAFCCRGSAADPRIREFKLQTVLAELAYIATRTKNPLKALYIADNNFGILKRDLEIARAIKELQRRDGSFKNIYMFFAKNTDARTIRVAETLQELTDISMSRQSLNPEVLEIIGRHNIADTDYERALAKLNESGASVFCELIYGLPGESRESFLDGLEKMAQKEVNVSVYPLLMLKGTKINSREFREKYQIRSAFRIMPRYVGSYGAINSVEYEELLISHANLSLDDYLQIRLIVFFHVLFYEQIFAELVLYLKENRLNLISFFRFLAADRPNWPAKLKAFLAHFEGETRAELIDAKDVKLDFTREEINEIQEKAVDLNTYHLCRLFASREQVQGFKEYLCEALQRFLAAHSLTADPEELTYLLDFCFDKVPDFSDIKKRKTLFYPYDLESWLANEGAANLAAFRTPQKIKYLFKLHSKARQFLYKQQNESMDTAAKLYRLRKKFIVLQINPVRAYTYQRTRL